MSHESSCAICEDNDRRRCSGVWKPGPWMDEPDRVEFEAHGLPCILHRNAFGAWCGYAAVPPGHPWHGKDYDGLGQGISVHGGLTYASTCDGHICHVAKPGQPDDVWWFGFDCNHAFDFAPSGGGGLSWPMEDVLLGTRRGSYRDLAYVREQTESLAKQLSERR